jgi:hypothetical protein
MFIFDVTSPMTLILLLAATVLLIFLGRETKRSFVPALSLVLFLVLLVVHCFQLTHIPELNYEIYHSTLLGCVTVDLVMIFITFFSYLWIDDISSKFYKKKSIDNSLDWFWKQV